MHLHIVRVATPNLKTSRPAKVIQLETRRKARLAQERLERSRPLIRPPETGAYACSATSAVGAAGTNLDRGGSILPPVSGGRFGGRDRSSRS